MQSKATNQPLTIETGQALANTGRWEARQELPIETEILIPDYLPAVFKIVKCLLEPVIMQNNVADRRWQCSGYLRCTVYYQSDEAGTRLYRTEQKYAFEKTIDLPEGNYLPGAARLWGELEYCNCRSVSEHRIDIRGAYTLNAAIGMVEPVELITNLTGCGVEQRCQQLNGVICTVCEERTFTAETPFPLSSEGETILDITGSFLPGTASVHTGQLDVSGTLAMQLCSRVSGAEQLTVQSKDVPITQTIDLPAAADGDSTILWGDVLACTLTAVDSEKEPLLSITWKLHAELWRPAVYMAVSDAYSTICNMELEKRVFSQFMPLANIDASVPVIIEDDLPDSNASILGCFVTLGAPQLTAAEKGNALQITGRGTAHLICADDRGELTCYDKAFPWALAESFHGSIGQSVPHLHAAVRHIASSRSGSKARVELELQVNGILLQGITHEIVSAATPGEEYPDRKDGPALYLYYAQKGEAIFDIARRYHARANDLAAANHLTIPEGQSAQDLTADETCLLIPAAL